MSTVAVAGHRGARSLVALGEGCAFGWEADSVLIMSWLSRFFRKEKEPVHGFLHVDFVRTFPHVFWTSGWGHDGEFPEGFRYKVLSMRYEPEGDFEVVLVRELRDGTKEERQRFSAPRDKFAASEELIRMLEADLSVKFDRVDMSTVRSFDEFEARSRAIGWEVS